MNCLIDLPFSIVPKMSEIRLSNKTDLESDGDEFSDTFDHVSATGDEVIRLKDSNGIISARGEPNIPSHQRTGNNCPSRNDNQNQNRTSDTWNQDDEIIQGTGTQFISGAGAGGGEDGEGLTPVFRDQNDINHHLARTILSLQHNIQNLSERINSLEVRINVSGNLRSRISNSSGPNWWPFKSSSSSLVFFLAYPILIYLAIERLKRNNNKR
ncbi:acyl-CoA-binding domain-containing protein 5-like [Brevipalpus obovatus]|uniref:acyl-CoA-binding domain-containing protein 5-like n=1 Tax=Brevipalpus obovatus TaxID=246614 RepID=UPI003D9F2AC5